MSSSQKNRFDLKHILFRTLLLKWNEGQIRPMPWKGEKDPYLIWLSEIILQQTRVVQGLPYFERFKKAFPSIQDLAQASDDEVMKLWEGLGYYSRARNLHVTAKYISEELNGIFPKTHVAILSLKGVGPYTAAAIASFAYGLPHAVVDGNVYRVLSRIFNIGEPIGSTTAKKYFAKLAGSLLDDSQPGIYNQAIMDFGATLCVPKNPNCSKCPMQKHCKAFKKGLVNSLPVKLKKAARKKRFFNYIIVKDDKGRTAINKRVQKDIWQNLFDFPLIETANEINLKDLKQHASWISWFGHKKRTISYSKSYKQILTHQHITAVFWEVSINNIEKLPLNKLYRTVCWEMLESFAFPKIIGRYLFDMGQKMET